MEISSTTTIRKLRVVTSKPSLRPTDYTTLRPFVRSWKPIVNNIEARFDAYLEQENRVNRAKLIDNRIHACIYFIQPTGHS
jgi:hypothetical protein